MFLSLCFITEIFRFDNIYQDWITHCHFGSIENNKNEIIINAFQNSSWIDLFKNAMQCLDIFKTLHTKDASLWNKGLISQLPKTKLLKVNMFGFFFIFVFGSYQCLCSAYAGFFKGASHCLVTWLNPGGGHVYNLGCVWPTFSWQSLATQPAPSHIYYLPMPSLQPRSHDLD